MTVEEFLKDFHGGAFISIIESYYGVIKKQERYNSCQKAIEKWGNHVVRYWIIEENTLEIRVD
jgi:hypothetical protein